MPAPYWVSHAEMPKLSGAKVVTVPCTAADGFCMQPEQLEQALSPHTKAVILCNPNNPTGSVYSASLLERLAAVLRRPEYSRVWIIYDEVGKG